MKSRCPQRDSMCTAGSGPSSQLHVSAHAQLHTHALQDDAQPKASTPSPWEDKHHRLLQLDEKQGHRVSPAKSLSRVLCQSQEWNLSDETLSTPNGSPSMRPVLPRSVQQYLLCLLCAGKHKVDAYSSPKRCPGKQSPYGRARQQLSSSPLQHTAAGPVKVMLTEDLAQLSLPKPTPEKKHFSTSWYSQTGPEVLIPDLFDYCQFQSLPISTVPWNYSNPFLFFFNFIPFQSFYYFSDSRWQSSLSQTET